MKKHFHILATTLILTFVLTGCSTKLSQAQQDEIKTVTVITPIMEDQKNLIINPSAKNPGVQDSIGMAGGGLIPSLIGAAIDAGIRSYKKGSFEEKYPEESKFVSTIKIENIEENVKKEITAALKNDDFFANKLRDNGQYQVKTKIHSYELNKVDELNNEIRFGAAINLIVELKDTKDSSVFTEYITGTSEEYFNIKELAKDEQLVHKLFSQAYKKIDFELSTALDKRLGREHIN